MALFRRKRRKAAAPRAEPSLFARDRSDTRSKTRSGSRRRRRPVVFSLLSWGLTLCLWALIGLGATTAYVFANLDQQGLFKIPARAPGMMLISSDGHVIAERGSFFGDEAKVAELPRYLPQAVIAIEDRRFYRHFGLDVQGLVRAMIANYRAGRVVQGGSTITQQLAKNLFLKPERTLERKVQEAVLALWLESKYSKDEILQLYLNRVYFGAGAYGVEKAAQAYFDKSAREVSLGEAAILAAVLKAPTRYNPLRHPRRAQARADEVVKDMIESGFITPEQARRARDVSQTVKPAEYVPATQYIVDWVADQLPQLIGTFDRSIVVETTLDRSLQEHAEESLRRHLAEYGADKNFSEGALVVMDTTGAVKAMVGGKSYKKSQFNRVVQAKRQPGSAFKPFVYLSAIEMGMSPDTVEVDGPVKIGDWTPANYGNKFRGRITLRNALALSVNTVAAKVGAAVGVDAIIDTAHRLGIKSELERNASLALGTSEVTLLELTAAYAPFANGGSAVPPHVVKRILTRSGEVLYERRGSGLGQIVSPYEIGAMNDMLRTVVQRGTGKRAQLDNHEVAGKTGTSQDYRDAWFIGFTSHLVAGVWIGNDDNSPTGRVTGGNVPAMIWKDVMAVAHAELPPVTLPGDDDPLRDGELPMVLDTRDGRSFVNILQDMFGSPRSAQAPAREPQRDWFTNRPQSVQETERRRRLDERTRRLQDSR